MYENLVPIIIDIIKTYGYVIVFLGSIVAGEIIILLAVFLASLKLLNIYLVIIFSIAGVMVGDSLWFYMGSKLKDKVSFIGRFFKASKYHKAIASFAARYIKNYKKYLIISKFVYGFRVITILTSGYYKIPYRSFVIYNTIGTIIELSVVVFLGYTMGLSWVYLSRYSGQAKYLVLFGLLILFMLRYGFRKKMNYSNTYGQ